MNETTFSTDYLTQLFQRIFKAQSPRFFNVLTTVFALMGGALLLIMKLESGFTDKHLPVPEWMNITQTVLQVLLSFSGIISAQATIKTPDTPPLASEIEKPTLESLAKQVAELKAQNEALLHPNVSTMPVPTSFDTPSNP